MVGDCGLADVAALAERCQALRESLGKPSARWSAKCLSAAAQAAVKAHGWPADLLESALVAVAADRESRSPMRVAEGGPWWDAAAAAGRQPEPASDLAELEARLDELGGGGARLRALARAERAGEGLPLTRATVVRRACELLDRAESDIALEVAAL